MTRLSKLLCATALIAVGGYNVANATTVLTFTYGSTPAVTVGGDGNIGDQSTLGLVAGTVSAAPSPNSIPAAVAAGDASNFNVSSLTVAGANVNSTLTGNNVGLTFTFGSGDYVFTALTGYVYSSELVNSPIGVAGGNFSGTWVEGGTTYDATLSINYSETTPASGVASYSGVFTGTDIPANVPEPISMTLFGLGVAGIAAARRRRGGV